MTRLSKVSASLVLTSIVLSSVLWSSGVVSADDFNLETESVTTGYSADPTNRNAEDGNFNTLTEADTYSDTNFSGSSESVPDGTAGGGSFPTALDTDDSTRRSYTEENTGGSPPSNYQLVLMPDEADSTADEWSYSTTSTLDDVNDIGETSDYIYATASGQGESYFFEDLPSSEYTRTYDVRFNWYDGKSASPGCTIVVSWAAYSGSWGEVYFQDYYNPSTTPTNRTSGFLTINPFTSAEWTTAEINSLTNGFGTNDAVPNPRIYSVFVTVWVNYTATANYELDAQITYSSVTSTSQTTGYSVYCQGYRTGTENFGIYAWDYTGSSWTLKDTIDQGSDTDFNFDLASTERDGTNNEVKLKVEGLTETSDTTQDVVYLDVLKVKRKEIGYGLDVTLSTTAAPQYGDVWLRIKGYTDGETFTVSPWNYTTSSWDASFLSITSLSNTWQTEKDLSDTHHRSTQSVKVRIEGASAASSDQTQSHLYLDAVWITRYFSDPAISDYGAAPLECDEGETITFWMTYSDYDNQAPSYVRVHIGLSYYAMTANDSSTDYFGGKDYYFTKSDLSAGEYDYWFAVKDAESSEVTTSAGSLTVNVPANNPPSFTSTPSPTSIHNNTAYEYDADATDLDLDPLTFDLEGSIIAWAEIDAQTGEVSGVPDAVGDYWMNVSVTDGTATVWQNTSIHVYSDTPTITSTAIETWQHGTTYIYQATATDFENEDLAWFLTGNCTGILTITQAGLVSGLIPSMGYWVVEIEVTDGNSSDWQNYTLTALNAAPVLSNWPDTSGTVNESYSWTPSATDANGDELTYSIDTSPQDTLDWLTYNETSGAIEGTPNSTGSYLVNLSISDGLTTTWSNYTLIVSMQDTGNQVRMVLGYTLGLLFGMGLPFVSWLWHNPVLMAHAGFSWLYSSLESYMDISIGLTILSFGVGLMLLYKGGLDIGRE